MTVDLRPSLTFLPAFILRSFLKFVCIIITHVKILLTMYSFMCEHRFVFLQFCIYLCIYTVFVLLKRYYQHYISMLLSSSLFLLNIIFLQVFSVIHVALTYFIMQYSMICIKFVY